MIALIYLSTSGLESIGNGNHPIQPILGFQSFLKTDHQTTLTEFEHIRTLDRSMVYKRLPGEITH